MKHAARLWFATGIVTLAIAIAGVDAQQPAASPPAQAQVTIGGRSIAIKYSAPSVRGRRIFGAGGLLSNDPTYPIWRAGANDATALHTDADLLLGTGAGLSVPKGDYTLFVDVSNPDAWTLVVNKQTGQWGLTYDKAQDLGRVAMTMSRPPAPVEQLKYTLTAAGSNRATLQLAWEQHAGAVPIAIR